MAIIASTWGQSVIGSGDMGRGKKGMGGTVERKYLSGVSFDLADI